MTEALERGREGKQVDTKKSTFYKPLSTHEVFRVKTIVSLRFENTDLTPNTKYA